MFTGDITLDAVWSVQARIEVKVDNLASLLREYLENGPRPATDFEAEHASSINAPTLEATEDAVFESCETNRIENDVAARVSEMSRAWDSRSECVRRDSSVVSPVRQPSKRSSTESNGALRKSASSLDEWPRSIELLSRYNSVSTVDVASAIIARCSTRRRSAVFSPVIDTPSPNSMDITPNSSFCFLWALLTVIGVVLDSSATSLFLVWDQPQQEALKIAFAAFWTSDLIANCFKEKRGSEGHMLHLRESLIHYLQTWFALDFSLVCLDWAVIILKVFQHTDLSTWNIVNFLRCYKCVLFVDEIAMLKSYNRMILFLRVVSVLVYTIWILHVLSCFWLWIGIDGFSDTSRHWIDTAGSDFGDFISAPVFYQYTTSVHWVVSYANLGSIEMYCQNSIERICCVVFMLVSVYMSTIAVTVIAGVLLEFYLSHREQRKQLQTLRRFLYERNVESHVAGLVMGQARRRLFRHKVKLAYSDVHCLSLVSSALLRELKYALAGRFLEKQPLFGLWMRCNTRLAKDLAMATGLSVETPGATLFKPLVEASEMFYLISGDMVFIQDSSTSLVTSPRTVSVDVATWFCEAAMWTSWTHVGTMEAIDSCELCVLNVDETGIMLRQDDLMFRIAAAYAELFHYRIITAGPPRTVWPDDLFVPFTEYADLVMQLPPELVVYIGMDAVEVLSRNSARNKFSHTSWLSGQVVMSTRDLQYEVTTGKCVLLVNAQGEVKRIASVLTLKLENSSGQILYQLGKLTSKNVFEVEFKLPGKKRERGGSISDTIDRSPELAKLCGASNIVCEEFHEKFEFSAKYGVDTHYLLMVRVARLHDERIIDVFLPDADLIPEDTGIRQKLQELNSYTVCSLVEDEERTVYAWLDESIAEDLQDESGAVLIDAWMGCFDLVECFMGSICQV